MGLGNYALLITGLRTILTTAATCVRPGRETISAVVSSVLSKQRSTCDPNCLQLK